MTKFAAQKMMRKLRNTAHFLMRILMNTHHRLAMIQTCSKPSTPSKMSKQQSKTSKKSDFINNPTASRLAATCLWTPKPLTRLRL
jgi:hypothetical protein